MRNARFYTLSPQSEPVKLTLKPWQSIHHSRAWHNGEGWSRHSESFEFDGEKVTCHWHSSGTDCDGPHSSGGTSICAIDRLKSGYRDESDGVTYPDWQSEEEWQRDVFAEIAGY